MTIIAATVKELFPRPTSKSLSSGLTGTRKYQMQSDTVNELESNVYTATPVSLGDSFPGTLTCQCTDQSAEQDPASRDVWYVTCDYKSILTQTEQQRVSNPNPLDRTAKITWTSRTVMTAPTKLIRSTFYRNFVPETRSTPAIINGDKTYYPFTGVTFAENGFYTNHLLDGSVQIGSPSNSATDPFDPPVEAPITEWIATITKNLTDPPGWVLTYDNTVNSDEFVLDGLTVPIGCAKTEGIRIGEIMVENGFVYRTISLNVVLRHKRDVRTGGTYTNNAGAEIVVPDETDVPEPWDIEVLDEGMRTYSETSKKWSNIETTDGFASKPLPLDGDGQPLDPTEAKIPEFALWWRLFRPFQRKPFNGVLPLT